MATSEQLRESFETQSFGPELVGRVVDGVDAELHGLDQAALLAHRDRLLEGLLLATADTPGLPGKETP